jgi:hypothetical protein
LQFHRAFDRHVDEVLSAFRRNENPPVHARTVRRALDSITQPSNRSKRNRARWSVPREGLAGDRSEKVGPIFKAGRKKMDKVR